MDLVTRVTFNLQVRAHTKRESLMQNMHNKKDYPFDYFFEHTTAKANPPVGVVTDDDQTGGVVSTDERLCTEHTRDVQ